MLKPGILSSPSPFKTPCPQGEDKIVEIAAMVLDLKVLVLDCNSAIGSVVICPYSSIGGRVGIGVTC